MSPGDCYLLDKLDLVPMGRWHTGSGVQHGHSPVHYVFNHAVGQHVTSQWVMR